MLLLKSLLQQTKKFLSIFQKVHFHQPWQLISQFEDATDLTTAFPSEKFWASSKFEKLSYFQTQWNKKTLEERSSPHQFSATWLVAFLLYSEMCFCSVYVVTKVFSTTLQAKLSEIHTKEKGKLFGFWQKTVFLYSRIWDSTLLYCAT